MNFETILEIYELVSEGIKHVPSRKQTSSLRKTALGAAIISNSLIKVAFDTRRINQETQINPRRGLQNYSRSEAFISEALSEKLKSFSKLRNVLSELEDQYGREPEWQDSNARILLSTLDKGLRTNQLDGDYSESQPGVGNLGYIEELLHVRYRLGFEELNRLASSDLKRAILLKDEELTHRDATHRTITKRDIATQSYDSLLEKLFGNVHATAENPEVERTVTITIKDKFGA